MRLAVALAVLAVVLTAALVLALRSWRRRAAAQADLRLPAEPAGEAPDVVVADGLHVATVFAGRPLERVVVGGLGHRSAARLRVGADRVVVELASGRLALPASAVRGAGGATWTLDRTVEPGGLTVLAWSLDGPDGPVDVESAFRLAPGADDDVRAAVRALTAPSPRGSA